MMDLAKCIKDNESQAISTLQELISINSVAGDPVTTKDGEFYPFGNGVQDAFAYMLKKAEELGFEPENVDNYGGHIDFGKGSQTVGILGHLDVVPVGDGWDFDPFSGANHDGYIYGRGTTDDKGPVLAAFYAMKALKDAGYEPKKKIRLILGLDEETAWKGMEYYLNKAGAPDYGFTPDADFPALNGEKGIMVFEIAKKISKNPPEGLMLTKLSGGSAPNMVAETARAVVKSDKADAYEHIKELAEEYRSETGYKVRTKGVGKAFEITTEGVAAHGASPQDGLNAISILFDFMGRLSFANDDVNVFIDFYNKHIGFNVYGENIGCALKDEHSSGLSFNVGMAGFDGEAITIVVNTRYPVTCNQDQVYDGIMPYIDKYGLGVVKEMNQDPIFFDPDSPLITTLMDVYKEHTGDKESQPLVIGGGTYARACPNIVAFGGLFPGDPDIMHQRNERIAIDRYLQMIEIYADAIYKLSQEDFSIE
jgi:dipeptidase, putative